MTIANTLSAYLLLIAGALQAYPRAAVQQQCLKAVTLMAYAPGAFAAPASRAHAHDLALQIDDVVQGVRAPSGHVPRAVGP